MIDFVRGVLSEKTPLHAVIEAGGIGYLVHISLQTFEALPEPGSPVFLRTHLHVREDVLQLYGFIREEERAMFLLLQNVSGIGARMAMTILSGCGVAELHRHVSSGNIQSLTAIPGIGRKTAERIVVELRDKFSKIPGFAFPSRDEGTSNERVEAVKALVALGYSRQTAEKAISEVISMSENGQSLRIGELIKSALRLISP